ncbi:MAG TPA: Holliday junction branch migration DNA helicase RuvB, partial [Porphyromonadaceae bacterium]|nr:Holliday junction branch migration DNA helicase RuvB [Porphyromonadaceae bacterium]
MEETFDIHSNRHFQEPEREFENALRPLTFGSFNGQEKIVENLNIFVRAARLRGESLDHVL